MIVLDNITKLVEEGRFHKRAVVASVSLTIPSNRRIALLGPSFPDKKMFIDLLAGSVLLTSGRIIRKAQVSFPIGFLHGIERTLSVRVNVAHVARIYGVNPDETVEFVRQVAEMGDHFDQPYEDLPREFRKPLAQIVGLSLPFDAYLLADDDMRGGREYKDKCWALFEARRQTSGMIIPTESPDFVQAHCDMVMVLYQGQIVLFEDINEGLQAAQQLPAGEPRRKDRKKKRRRNEEDHEQDD